ncbi:MAG: EamA family transporter [Bacteroidetes bacterium]|nr:EamA family transporter [Bacteroidota bacterium]
MNFSNPYILIHTAVFLWGFTAILGKLISLDSLNLVWHRMLIASLAFAILNGAIGGAKKLPKKAILRLGGIGCIVALHWISFYGSIKIYNSASLTLACMGTSALFSSLIEPFVVGKKFQKSELFIGLLSFVGIYIICLANPSQGSEADSTKYFWAIVVGLIGSFLAAVFTSLNKKYAGEYETEVVSFIELSVGGLFLTLMIPFFSTERFVWIPSKIDFIYLLIMGIVCTNFTFNISLKALKQLSAFTANLSVNLEPVYGFILAAIIFKEHQLLNIYFYLGAFLILASVLVQPIMSFFKSKEKIA